MSNHQSLLRLAACPCRAPLIESRRVSPRRRLIVLSLRCGKERNAESVHDITDVLARPLRLAAVALEDRPSISGGGVRDRSEERRVGEEGRSRWSPYH